MNFYQYYERCNFNELREHDGELCSNTIRNFVIASENHINRTKCIVRRLLYLSEFSG